MGLLVVDPQGEFAGELAGRPQTGEFRLPRGSLRIGKFSRLSDRDIVNTSTRHRGQLSILLKVSLLKRSRGTI